MQHMVECHILMHATQHEYAHEISVGTTEQRTHSKLTQHMVECHILTHTTQHEYVQEISNYNMTLCGVKIT